MCVCCCMSVQPQYSRCIQHELAVARVVLEHVDQLLNEVEA